MNPRKAAEDLLEGFKISLPDAYRAPLIEAMIAGMVMAAADGAKKEREECAKVAEMVGPTFYHKDMREAAESIAATIRARGEK